LSVRLLIVGLTACCWLAACGARAQGTAAPALVDVPAGELSPALAELARETGSEILFDQRLVRGLRSKAVRDRVSVNSALSRMLAGSRVAHRRTADGAFVLFASGAADGGRSGKPEAAGAEEPSSEITTVAEVLVIGRRTQNADIARTENDVQPYKVLGTSEIRSALRDDVDDLLRSRGHANARNASPSQEYTVPGDTRSAIDLRGLGTARTLVLVDGRRMPAIPTVDLDPEQADLNGIPLGAIDRIETLTGTAGGIHGPGALGGVVNVILKRDYDGGELRFTHGVTSRDDARTIGVEGRLGFTINDGRTNLMVAGGLRTAEPLRVIDRDFYLRQRLMQFSADPAGYLRQSLVPGRTWIPPIANAVTVFSVDGRDLTLDPVYGGGSLGASFSYLPLGFAGTRDEAVALLKQNAGKLVFEAPGGPAAGDRFLRARPSAASAILNMRHRVSDRLEGYADLLLLRNEGDFEVLGDGGFVTLPNAATNPFTNLVHFTFPRLDQFGYFEHRLETRRLSVGALMRLGGGWSAAGDHTLGATEVKSTGVAKPVNFDLLISLQTGLPGPIGQPVVDPLSPTAQLYAALEAYPGRSMDVIPLTNRFDSTSVRLAGPLLRLSGGPLTLTALLERRREHVPVTERRFGPTGSVPSVARVPERRQTVNSAYAELRAPLSDVGGLPLLRDLELQLAARYDDSSTYYAPGFGAALSGQEVSTEAKRGALTYTVGARIHPSPALMIRASAATGEITPSIAALLSDESTVRVSKPQFADPRRGGRPAGTESPVRLLYGQPVTAKPERAVTVAIGAVLNPRGGRWPRISADYSEIRKEREPYSFSVVAFDEAIANTRVAGVLANEAVDPRRVIRGDLTDADRALGFTGGVIREIDIRGASYGNSVLKVLDLDLDWTLRTAAVGDFRLYASGVWQPTLRRRTAAQDLRVERVDSADGPLRWRGDAGVDWTRGDLVLGLNVQHFASYSPLYSDPAAAEYNNAQILRFQPDRIPAQTYLDLSARRRFSVTRFSRLRTMELEVGVANLFDARPPTTADVRTPGYSYYGDPRRRRFHLALSAGF